MSTTKFFFYGTLMSDEFHSHVLAGLAWPVQPALAQGTLHAVSLGSFPAMLPGQGVVVGQLWEALDESLAPGILDMLDMIEGYHPHMPERSLYIRQEVELLDPEVTAWTYIWNGSLSRLTAIRSGDWRRWLRQLNEPDFALSATEES